MSRISPISRHEQSHFRQVCLAIVLAAGLNIVWGAGVGWTVAVVSTIARPDEPFVQTPPRGRRHPRPRSPTRDGRPPEDTTLDGNPYPATDATHWLQGASFPIETLQAQWSLIKPVAPRIEGFTDALPSPTDWFFIQFRKPRPIGYFVGYDRVSQLRVGYLGRSGFQVGEPTGSEAFPINRNFDVSWDSTGIVAPPGTSSGVTPAQYYFQNVSAEPSPGKIPGATVYIIAGDRAYQIDLRARTVKPVVQAPI